MKHQEEMNLHAQEDEQADDVATLYSWANLHGAKYRDFSASRQEMRAQMRQRALAEQARAELEESRPAAAPVPAQPIPEPIPEPLSAAETVLWQDLQPDPERRLKSSSSGHIPAAELRRDSADPAFAPAIAPAAPPVLPEQPPARRPSGQGIDPVLIPRRNSSLSFDPSAPVRRPSGQGLDPITSSRYGLPMREHESLAPPRSESGRLFENGRAQAAAPAGPAWLTERPSSGSATETLQPVRERTSSRWFALRGFFSRDSDPQVERAETRLPALAVFSLAGGVGKTSLVAGLGRAFAARGERVLLADAASFGMLPFYFGAREVKPGVLRTFGGTQSDSPIRLLSVDLDRDNQEPDFLKKEIGRCSQDVGRVLIDVTTASPSALAQALRLSPALLVPLVPDMTSVVTLQSMESLLRTQDKPVQPWYVLSQFDPALPLHLDVREVLRQQLGERLLSFPIHRTSAVSEALAEGMTVIDYAPGSPAAEDLMNLVNWVRTTSAAGSGIHRGLRWSER